MCLFPAVVTAQDADTVRTQTIIPRAKPAAPIVRPCPPDSVQRAQLAILIAHMEQEQRDRAPNVVKVGGGVVIGLALGWLIFHGKSKDNPQPQPKGDDDDRE